jgi:hypothetical protein
MSSHYSIVKFVPDPVANESVNIGVVAFSETESRAEFVKSWVRARHLGGAAANALQSFAEEFQAKQFALFRKDGTLSPESLKHDLRRWSNCIQFTELRGSLKGVDALFPDLVAMYLKDTPSLVKPKIISKRQVVAQVFDAFERGVTEELGSDARSLLKRKYSVEGAFSDHSYDVAIANGQLYGAALGFSFMVAETHSFRKEIDAAAFAVEDLKAADKHLPIAIAYAAPNGKNDAFDRAKRVFVSLGAEFLPSNQLDDWTRATARRIPLGGAKQSHN